MSSKKTEIMLAALKLFARDGYEAVSVSDIAGQLGMTKSALYKHYTNKRDIFDSIVTRMGEIDNERTKTFAVSRGEMSDMDDSRRDAAISEIKAFSIAQYRYWTEDEFASPFRKMMTLEQYRNPEMAGLLRQYLTGGVIGYAQNLIREMAARSGGGDKNPAVLALEYFAPIYMLMNLYDGAEDKDDALKLVEAHIDYFMERLR